MMTEGLRSSKERRGDAPIKRSLGALLLGIAMVGAITTPASSAANGAVTRSADQLAEDEQIIYISDTCASIEPPGSECDTEIYIVALDGSEPQRLTSTENSVEEFPAYSPDGTEIAFNSWDRILGDSGLWLMEADGSNARQISSPVSSWDEGFGWAPDGKIAFARWSGTPAGGDGHADVLLLSRVGEVWTEEPLLTRPGSENMPAFSPNGRRIAYDYDPDKDGAYSPGESQQSDVWVARADGTKHERLTHTRYLKEGDPTWSPDGKWIAYARGTNLAYWKKTGRAQIWMMRADGSHKRRLTPKGYLDVRPSWSPDGTKIVFSRCRSTRQAFDCGIAVIEVAHPDRVEMVVDEEGLLEAEPSWRPEVGS